MGLSAAGAPADETTETRLLTGDPRADCLAIRRDILRCSHISGHGHIPTCFSVVEILYAVYSSMRHDPARPDWDGRDLFILSKGHASLGLYCALARFGYFPPEDVETFGAHGSRFGCHADRLKVPGVEASTGSLGHGIGLAAGMALGLKIRRSARRVTVLIGDGEANEGSVWEAVMVAADRKLDNLTVILDYNHSQGRSLQIRRPEAMFESFGCETLRVDGHSAEKVAAALEQPASTVKAVVAETRKGRGCRTLTENMFEWHRKSPNAEQYRQLLGELDAEAI